MSNRHSQTRLESMRIAFCGMVVALSVVLMLTSSLIPVMTYAAPLMCGLLLTPVQLEFNRSSAFVTFGATALLILILGFDKELAFFYIFFGYYPLIKWRIDRLPGKGIRVLLKLLVFSLSLTLMYLFLTYVLRVTAVIADFQEMGRIMTVLFFLAMLVCLMLYDRLLTPLTIIYVTRWQPKLRKLMKR